MLGGGGGGRVGVTVLSKMVYNRVGVGPRGGAIPYTIG